MDEITIAAETVGLTQIFKKFGIPNKYLMFFSLVVAFALPFLKNPELPIAANLSMGVAVAGIAIGGYKVAEETGKQITIKKEVPQKEVPLSDADVLQKELESQMNQIT